MVEIEFHVGSEDASQNVVSHTIYSDIVDMPATLYLGLTVRVFNYTAGTLYFQLDGAGTGWTFPSTVNLGSILSGGNQYYNNDQFGNRSKPAAETTGSITVTLTAYSDAGYTILVDTYVRTIYYTFIKSDDGSWTEDDIDNFDDGTVMGWASQWESGDGYCSSAVAIDFVLSAAYSLKLTMTTQLYGGERRARLYKTFNTPNRTYVYAIANVRVNTSHTNPHAFLFRNDTTVLVQIGRLAAYSGVFMTENKWMRVMIPLPANTAVPVQLAFAFYDSGFPRKGYLWLDDFRIISKN